MDVEPEVVILEARTRGARVGGPLDLPQRGEFAERERREVRVVERVYAREAAREDVHDADRDQRAVHAVRLVERPEPRGRRGDRGVRADESGVG